MTDPLWLWSDLISAAAGTADGSLVSVVTVSERASGTTGFSIDTRTLRAGEVFVALRDQRDGHAFVPDAFSKGAAAALVEEGYQRRPGDGALLRVDDPLRALERIGRAARARLTPEACIVAVTGSAGKTGTKEMLRLCLSQLGSVHASEKSFNNHWGVPLTLARMPPDVRFAVFEMGMNHAGEIAPLSELVRPHVAVITNVLPVHIGQFAGEEEIARAKAEVFTGLVPGAAAILNADNSHFAALAAIARAKAARIVSFGTSKDCTVRAVSMDLAADGTALTVELAGRTLGYRVGAPGAHIATNSLAVVAALHALDQPLETALAAMAGVSAPVGRGARTTFARGDGDVLLIDESYNANPASMRAALAVMATVPRGAFRRRVAVLGEMLELGAGAAAFHRGLKDAVDAAGVDLVFACGPNMRLLFDDLPAPLRGSWSERSVDLRDALLDAIRPGDVVMIKGSFGTRMAPLVEAFVARLGDAAHDD